jgi:hypothetical protein
MLVASLRLPTSIGFETKCKLIAIMFLCRYKLRDKILDRALYKRDFAKILLKYINP